MVGDAYYLFMVHEAFNFPKFPAGRSFGLELLHVDQRRDEALSVELLLHGDAACSSRLVACVHSQPTCFFFTISPIRPNLPPTNPGWISG